MWLGLEHVEHLSVPEEGGDDDFYHVLEDEVLVVIAQRQQVLRDVLVDRCLPLIVLLNQIRHVVDLLLSHVSIQDLLVDSVSKSWRDSTLGILNKERLVVFLQQTLSNEDSFVDKRAFFVYSDLPKCNIKLIVFAPQLVQGLCIELQLNLSP